MKGITKLQKFILGLGVVLLCVMAFVLRSTYLASLDDTLGLGKTEVEVAPERYVYASQKGLFLQAGEDDSLLASFDQLVRFDFPHLVAVVNNEAWYWQLNDAGEIIRTENLGSLPDLILAMHVQVLQVAGQDYLTYVIPLRGLRVVNLETKENYLVKDSAFFRMFIGNELVVREQSIFVSNGEVPGGISMWEVNLQTRAGAYTGLSTLPCGAGDWHVQANVGSAFALSLGSRVCLIDPWTGVASVLEGKWANQFVNFSLEGELLAIEEFELIDELPVSTGRLAIYDTETMEWVIEADLSGEALVQERRGASGGSLSLIGQVQKFGEEIRLVSRGTEKILETTVIEGKAEVKEIAHSVIGVSGFRSDGARF